MKAMGLYTLNEWIAGTWIVSQQSCWKSGRWNFFHGMERYWEALRIRGKSLPEKILLGNPMEKRVQTHCLKLITESHTFSHGNHAALLQRSLGFLRREVPFSTHNSYEKSIRKSVPILLPQEGQILATLPKENLWHVSNPTGKPTDYFSAMEMSNI